MGTLARELTLGGLAGALQLVRIPGDGDHECSLARELALWGQNLRRAGSTHAQLSRRVPCQAQLSSLHASALGGELKGVAPPSAPPTCRR